MREWIQRLLPNAWKPALALNLVCAGFFHERLAHPFYKCWHVFFSRIVDQFKKSTHQTSDNFLVAGPCFQGDFVNLSLYVFRKLDTADVFSHKCSRSSFTT